MPSDAKSGRLLAFRNDRLGARLITLINAMRLARDHDLPLAVRWNHATDIGHIFNDPAEFFDQGFVAAHFIGEDAWRASRDTIVSIGQLGTGDIGELREVLAGGRDILINAPFGLTVLAGEDAASVRARVSAMLGAFPFAAALRPTVAQIDAGVQGGTAYHVRRGDLIEFPRAMNRAWPKKFVPDEIYMLHIEREIAAGARPVIFSDHGATIAAFRARYPELATAEDLFDATDLTPGQRDLMELYAMSRCAKIIAPGQSAFSSTAADLGGARRVEVTDDLPPEDREAALERMAARLGRAGPAEVARDPGTLGQSLVHAVAHLSAAGRQEEAAATLGGRIADGLDISFLYPMQIALQSSLGDHEGAAATGALMRRRVPYHRADHAAGEVLHGIARIALGKHGSGIHHIANGFWHEPDSVLSRTAVGMLFEMAVLDGRNFLPMSPSAQALRRRMARDALGDPRFAPIREAWPNRLSRVRTIPGLEPLGWDWGPLLRGFSPRNVARHPHRQGYEKALAKLPRTPDGESLAAMHVTHCDGPEVGLAMLSELARRHPEEAIVQHRRSHALMAARDFEAALAAAGAAARLAPGVPAHAAWHGMLLLRVRRFAEAAGALAEASAGGLTLPSVHGLLAQAHLRAGAQDAALTALGRAIADAPGEQNFRYDRAHIHAAAGRHAAALGDLELLQRLDKQAPKIVMLLADCLAATGRPEEARAALEAGAARMPKHSGMANRLKAFEDAI